MGEITKLQPENFVAKSAIRAVVRSEIKQVMNEVLAPGIGLVVARLRKEFEARLRETLSEFKFKGTWSEGILYKAGNFVTQGGQVYHANHDNKDARPGVDNVSWSLVCKSGRDGRDGVPQPLEPPPAPEPEPRTVRSNRR